MKIMKGIVIKLVLSLAIFLFIGGCGEDEDITPTCADGIQNGTETGVDCGGADCTACPIEPTCTDGIQNGTETGVDCGGATCPTCVVACGSTITDIDGNIYNTVTIGTQCWMVENLKTSKYNDGTTIPTDLSDTAWENTTRGAYAIYENIASNNTTYGKLYNWYAVNTRKLCPEGWHIPTDAEWNTLNAFLGGQSIAGGKMKSITGWTSPNTGATNSSGFTGLPGGLRSYFGGFSGIGDLGVWWSSTEGIPTSVWFRGLQYNDDNLGRGGGSKKNGLSCRCLRD
jgi:uncharacterized protein (TIGR02145 family)